MALLVTGALLAASLGPLAQVASAQCADPRGNSYCSNNGQVTFSSPPSSAGQNTTTTTTNQSQVAPQSQGAPQAPPAGPSSAVVGQGNASLSVDPPAAPAGATVTVTVSGMPPNSGFVVNLGQLKTSTGLSLGAKSMQTTDGSTPRTGPDGSFSDTFTVPAVPDATAPQASICASILGQASYCTPFTLQSAGQAPANDATPQSIVGHYQCSSELLVGFGSQWCDGAESLLVLNADGTYSVGDESGSYTFDPGSFAISFSGPLGSGSILNRKLVTDSSVNGAEVRYTFIRMDY